MKYFIILLLYGLRLYNANPYCPKKCKCIQNVIMKCNYLDEEEVHNVMISLATPYWVGLKELTIWNSPSLLVENIPAIEKLEILDISKNQLNYTWSFAKKQFFFVRKLVVEYNNLEHFNKNFLYPFPSLEEMYIAHNNFTELGVDYMRMPRMRIISAHHNSVKQFPFYTLRYMPYLSDVDFSHNKITQFASSSVSLVGSLRYLNLSGNLITSITSDTTQNLPALETLDLSNNLIDRMPTTELKDFSGLRLLNLSGNPIEVVGDRYLSMESLKVLDLSHCNLRVIESGAFSSLVDLHTLHLNNNPSLLFISPAALENKTIFSMDLTNAGLKVISPRILHQVAQVRLTGIPFDCGCLLEILSEIGTTTIRDWDDASCKTRSGNKIKLGDLSSSSLNDGDECRPDAIVPMKPEIHAFTGQTVALYCSGNREDDVLSWKTPDGVVHESQRPQSSYILPRQDFFTTTLFEPQVVPSPRERTIATSEYYRIDVLLEADQGEYICLVKHGKSSVSRSYHLVVQKPPIQLTVSKVGITFLHVVWNMNLQIFASDRVSLTIESFSSEVDHHRSVQIQLDTMFLNYNLINLTPNKNYTVCLRWRLTDDNTLIYSNCVVGKTDMVRGILDEVSPESIAVGGTLFVIIVLYIVISKVWRTFHIYSTSKKQSKLIQSVSGQSILSRSISSDATMYENHQMEMISSRSSNSAREAAGPLLNQHV